MRPGVLPAPDHAQQCCWPRLGSAALQQGPGASTSALWGQYLVKTSTQNVKNVEVSCIVTTFVACDYPNNAVPFVSFWCM